MPLAKPVRLPRGGILSCKRGFVVWCLYVGETPFSHLEMVCRLIPKASAAASWERPWALRAWAKHCPKSMVFPPFRKKFSPVYHRFPGEIHQRPVAFPPGFLPPQGKHRGGGQVGHRPGGISEEALRSVVAGQEGPQGLRHPGDGHGLEPHGPRAGEKGMEEPLPAQELVLQAGDLLDVHGDPHLEAGHVAGVHQKLLPGAQSVFHQFPVDLRKGRALAGEALHDEPLPAEETGPQLFAEVDVQRHPGLRGQEGPLLEDELLPRADGQGEDPSGEAGAEGDHGPVPLGSVDVLEDALPGEGLGKHLAQAAAGGLHLEVRGLPDHGAALGDHLLAFFHLAYHHGEGPAFDFIGHGLIPFSARRSQIPCCVSSHPSRVR